MPTDHHELNAIIRTLKQGRTAEPVSIRDFLSWFDCQRRTVHNVAYIDQQMLKGGISTVPSYKERWVDAPIGFELTEVSIGAAGDATANKTPKSGSPDGDAKPTQNEDIFAIEDPAFRIGNIASAKTQVASINPNSSLAEAMTMMLARNFSQLPVMPNERDVKGVISWTSIGIRLAANVTGQTVQSYMAQHQEVSASASMFSVISAIAEHDYVLVRAVDRTISGIVTASDIALQFEKISTPFLLLAEIENHIRALIAKHLNKSDVVKACSAEFLPQDFNKLHELTFGNCVRVLENSENWSKLKLAMDRKAFCQELSSINKIRNDVMHFNPDPITPESMTLLQNAARMFTMLHGVGAY